MARPQPRMRPSLRGNGNGAGPKGETDDEPAMLHHRYRSRTDTVSAAIRFRLKEGPEPAGAVAQHMRTAFCFRSRISSDWSHRWPLD